MTYPTFLEYIRAAYGTKWVVAHRMTDRLRRAGHEVAISPKRYDEIRSNWIADHPAYRLAESLPEHPERAFVLEAVRRKLQ